MVNNSGEDIARVVAALRAGNFTAPKDDLVRAKAVAHLNKSSPVVDATAIYESLAAKERPVDIYNDHPCLNPPWRTAYVCYQNEHGNVIAMLLTVLNNADKPKEVPNIRKVWKPKDNQNIDWSRAKWVIDVELYLGGIGIPMPMGPIVNWAFLLYENGEPADITWIDRVNGSYDMGNWDMAHLTFLGALNFLNCRNVELVEPKRSRAATRRIERTGERISVINVFGLGKRYKSNSNKSEEIGTPLTSVRGHFSTYGPEYGKGLLFGKYSGRYWIPQHARGDKSFGETAEQTYALKTDD